MTTRIATNARNAELFNELKNGASPRELIRKFSISYPSLRFHLRALIGAQPLKSVYIPAKSAQVLLLRRLGFSYERIGRAIGVSGSRARQLYLQYESHPPAVNPPILVSVTQRLHDTDGRCLICGRYKLTRRGADHIALLSLTGALYRVAIVEAVGKLRLPSDE